MSDTPSLLSLPREIRDIIWDFALPMRFLDIGRFCSYSINPQRLADRLNGVSKRLTRRSLKVQGMNLLLTNRQLLSEVAPVLYAVTIFGFDTPQSLLAFAWLVNEKSNLIREIHLDIDIPTWFGASSDIGRLELNNKHIQLAAHGLAGLRGLTIHFGVYTYCTHALAPRSERRQNRLRSAISHLVNISTVDQVSTQVDVQEIHADYLACAQMIKNLVDHDVLSKAEQGGTEDGFAGRDGEDARDQWEEECLRAQKIE